MEEYTPFKGIVIMVLIMSAFLCCSCLVATLARELGRGG